MSLTKPQTLIPMKTNSIKRALRSGYALVEVVVASSVLMIGVGAACVLSLTMIGQEEMHVRVARGVNVMENATRLYQLDSNLGSGRLDSAPSA